MKFSESTGAPRIHGELLKLSFEIAQSTVAKYMVRRHEPSSQGTFLRNHAPDIAAMDLFARRLSEAFPWNEAPQSLFAIGIASTAPSSHAVCVPWASGTSPLHRLCLGKMASLNG